MSGGEVRAGAGSRDALVAGSGGGTEKLATALPPNFIVVLLDDFGQEWVSDYGLHELYGTDPDWIYPGGSGWDDLVAEGALLTNANAQPICGPTRWAMLTSMAAKDSGFGFNHRDPNASTNATWPSYGLRVTVPFTGLPAALRAYDSRYRSLHVSKSHLADFWSAAVGSTSVGPNGYQRQTTAPDVNLLLSQEIGFDDWDISPTNIGGSYVYWRLKGGATLGANTTIAMGDGVTFDATTYPTSVFQQSASDWIDACGNTTPFFVYFAPGPPHASFTMPPHFSLTDTTLSSLPAAGTMVAEGANYAAIRTMFHASIESTFWHLRNLLSLMSAEVRARTYVIVMGDNGTVSNALPPGYTHVKRQLFRGGVSVPAVVQGPGIPAGVTRHGLFHVADIFPTVLRLAGADMAAMIANGTIVQEVYGVDQTPMLLGQVRTLRTELVCESFQPWGELVEANRTQRQWCSLTYPVDGPISQHRYRLVRVIRGATGTFTMYDQHQDFLETEDIAAEGLNAYTAAWIEARVNAEGWL